jgi:molybdopterin-containing oxidoreductase family iron-sulfur binding subunit
MSDEHGNVTWLGLRSRSGQESSDRRPHEGKRRAGWWRTLDELAEDPAFLEQLYNEFPSQVEAIADPVQRRTFLKLMGASLALAGAGACTRQPLEKIVPYVRQPEDIIPGRPLYYATAMTIGGAAAGLIVESHEGRPTKIEGNPDHPDNLGATDVFSQAALLDLYDPDRARAVTNLGEIRPWPSFLAVLRNALAAQAPLQGANLRILTETITSPTLAAQIRGVLARFPAARWYQWDAAGADNARAGARLAFGEYVSTRYAIAQADVIVALDADFLSCGPGSLRYAREFAARRRPDQADRMNRLYAVETMPTTTGARADHRLPARPGEVETIARQLASTLGVMPASGIVGNESERTMRWIAALARELQAHRGSSLVIAGDTQPPAVHALAHAINLAIGNAGRTVFYSEPIEAAPTNQLQELRDLAGEMNAGTVDIVVIVGGNPVYTAPVDLAFADALGNVPLRIHLSPIADETSTLCHWHIPEAHFLESWSDTRAFDGTVSIVQPLIAPLYGGRSAHELIGAMSETPEKAPHDLVREHWMAHAQGTQSAQGAPAAQGAEGGNAAQGAQGADAVDPAFERAWQKWLHDGVVPGTAAAGKTPTLSSGFAAALPPPAGADAGGFEIAFRLDPTVLDGRFANNGWLQELPKPITKLTWDNAVIASPATAERIVSGNPLRVAMSGGERGRVDAQVVELRFGGRTVRGPLFTVAGHPDECVTVHLGYGRARAGSVGTGAGFNAYAIRPADTQWIGRGVEIVATGDDQPLACTQYHHLMEGRGMVRAATREEFLKDPHIVHEGHHDTPRTLTLHPEYRYEGYKWGMAIDVNACIGCNACMIGCQAENNVPVVGKEQVLKGREMHWLRVDSYYRGSADNPETYFQPVPCMHCENAPCEVVCPVAATVHSHEGLNDMVYNRCIGTRYCSNNCPYKVRRFNYHLYQDWDTPSLQLGRNPDVTVRSRGVMEKCTYCVQRINEARIESEKAGRRIRDGEIRTACQQACPTDAIIFGDLNDPSSHVARLQAEERNYALLAELNTRPRTTYLAAVRNVNPELGE